MTGDAVTVRLNRIALWRAQILDPGRDEALTPLEPLVDALIADAAVPGGDGALRTGGSMSEFESEVDPFRQLKGRVRIAKRVNEMLHEEARRLHDEEGYSWADIGKALGVTRQAAWERFGKVKHKKEQA